MPERKGPRIQIGNLQKQAEETRRLVGETKDLVENKFGSAGTLRVLGETFLGSRQLTVAGSDGVAFRDWTWDEILRDADDLLEKQESEVRDRLNEELIVATTWQYNYFSQKRFRDKNRHFVGESQQVIDLVRGLLQEVSRSSEKLTYPWVHEKTEARYAAEALEVIRRTILKPTYILIEGHGEGPITSIPSYNEDEFWQSREEQLEAVRENLQSPDDHEAFLEAQKKATLHNPEKYSPEEWRRILEQEKSYLHEYLISRARRAYLKFVETVGYAESLYDGRRRVFYAKDIRAFIESNLHTGLAAYCIQGITDFEGIIPTFEQTFGFEASFRGILAMTDSRYYDLGYIKPNPALVTKP